MLSIHRSRAAWNEFVVECADTMEPFDLLAERERS
jgi:hypothetical protein